jgi:Flp pilus assembly protein TadG
VRTRITTSRGGSLVELAISLPFLCLLVLGVADMGRAFYYREAVANAGRQALRLASASGQQATGNTVCGTSTGAVTASSAVPASGGSIAGIVNQAAQESSSDGTAANSAIAGATITVTWHCTGSAAVTNATNQGQTDPTNAQSDAVKVTVSYPMQVVTPVLQPLFSPSGTVTIGVVLYGRVEY